MHLKGELKIRSYSDFNDQRFVMWNISFILNNIDRSFYHQDSKNT